MYIKEHAVISRDFTLQMLHAAREHGVAVLVQASWPTAELLGQSRAQHKGSLLALLEHAALQAKEYDDVLDEIYDHED